MEGVGHRRPHDRGKLHGAATAGTPDQGAFTWDGAVLRTYPVVDIHHGEAGELSNAVSAVNRNGVAIGSNRFVGEMMVPDGVPALEVPARFAGGVTTFLDPVLGMAPSSIDARGDIAGAGFLLDPQLHAMPFPGSSTLPAGAPVLPQAFDTHGDAAGTSGALRTFGNPFGTPGLFGLHVFLARAGTGARDLGSVPSCPSPKVVGLADDDTIAGSCSDGKSSWTWNGAFRTLPPLPGDELAVAAAISPGGTIAGTSYKGSRSRAALWRGGYVVALASLTDGRDAVFDDGVGIGDAGWIVASGTRAAQSGSFLVVPAADQAEAERVASLPAGPSPIPSGAPAPPFVSSVFSTPLPGPEPLPPTHVAAKPRVMLREIWTGDQDGGPRFASDGRRFYVAASDVLQAFDARGTIVWKRPYRTIDLQVSDGTVFAHVVPLRLDGIDAATGALRWSAALPDVGLKSQPVLFAGDGIAASSFDRMDTYDLKSGRHLASLATPCEIGAEADGVFACRAVPPGRSVTTTTFIEGATGKQVLSLADDPNEIVANDSSLYEYSGHVVAVHPRAKTFDKFFFPGMSDPASSPSSGAAGSAFFDGDYVISRIDGAARRFRLDVDPRRQHVIPFPAGATVDFAAGDGLAAFADDGGPLIVTSFDAAGTPSAIAYDGIHDVTGRILIRNKLVFAQTSAGVAIVDPVSRRVDGLAAEGCGSLEGAASIGHTAIIGCHLSATANDDRSQLTLVDLATSAR